MVGGWWLGTETGLKDCPVQSKNIETEWGAKIPNPIPAKEVIKPTDAEASQKSKDTQASGSGSGTKISAEPALLNWIEDKT